MAYFDDEQDKRKSLTLSEGGKSKGPSSGGSSVESTPQQGSGFTNLQRYVDANQGEAQRLNQSAGSGFGDELKSDKDAVSQGLERELDSLIGIGDGINLKLGGSYSDFTPQEYQLLKNPRLNEKEFGGYDSLLKNWDNRTEKAGSASHRKVLADEAFGGDRSDYNSGMKTLDSFIMGADVDGLKDSIMNQKSKLTDFIGDNAQTYNQRRDLRNDQIQSFADSALTGFDKRVSDLRGQRSSLMGSDEYGDDFIARGKALDEELARLENIRGNQFQGFDWDSRSQRRLDEINNPKPKPKPKPKKESEKPRRVIGPSRQNKIVRKTPSRANNWQSYGPQEHLV